ncbi:MAG TPA: hypothetical protein VJ836_00595 [Candidatus Saccharimonadales bacterium]|nr:hypothetical protein [Candidatus Saccharimonadales bacterium]
MGKTFQIPATLEGITALKDGGLSIRFHTQEVDNKDKLTAMEFFQSFGWMLFSEQEQNEDTLILEEIRKDVGGKTPSQRLRSVLYILYQQSGRTDVTFEQYYLQKMEYFINLVKQNLKD